MGSDMNYVGGVDQGPKEGPGGVKAIMKRFQQDRAVRPGQFGPLKEDVGLGGVGDRRLFEKDMLACADSTDGPFKVQTVGVGESKHSGYLGRQGFLLFPAVTPAGREAHQEESHERGYC